MIQLLKWKKILHECRAPILFKMYSFLLYIALFHFAAAKVLDDHQSKSEINLNDHIQPLDIGRNLTYDDVKDDGKNCARNCTRYSKPRTCYYKFVVEQYHSMGPACKNCPFNREDCFSPQCIIGHGMERTILSFNRMIPGPAIHVCYGDRIIVDVHNKMPARETTIHWHGMLQQKTPWMDGVPYITQCPIQTHGILRYDFYANTAGSHFYHSHSGFQIFDGLSGALIVRTSEEFDSLDEHYDYDLFSHTILLQDWMHVMMDDKYPGYNKDRTLITIKPDTYLINGIGSYVNPITLTSSATPFAEFIVKPDKRYRFRIIGVASTMCSYRFTIEGHSMKLIAADGYPIKSRIVRSLYMSAGDVYDVVIKTSKKPRSYWIRVQGLGAADCTAAFQQAVLKYEGTENVTPATLNTVALFDAMKFPELNNVRKNCHHVKDNLCLDELQSLTKAPEELLVDEPDDRFVFKIGVELFTTEELYLSNDYHRHYLPFSGPGVQLLGGAFTDTINNKTNILPPFPLLSDPKNSRIDELMCPKKCDKFCECLHLIRLKLNSVVEIILIDKLSNEDLTMDHPFHLHGHNYRVMKLGTRNDLKNTDFYRFDKKKKYPMIRDTIPIPGAGFAVLRFIADNPGFWTLHCHFTIHSHNGMVVVFQVGDTDEIPQVPESWPTCGNYMPSVYNNDV